MALSFLGKRFNKLSTFRFTQQIRTGYIVLLPEVNPDQYEKNPLYDKAGYPDSNNLKQDKCVNALGKCVLDFEECVRDVDAHIIENQTNVDLFEDVLDPLEAAGTKLESTWGIAKAMYYSMESIMPASSFLPLHERARKARSAKYTSRHIYNVFKGVDATKLSEEEQRVVSKFRIEGKLNGLDLNPEKKELFNEIIISLAKDKDDFKQKTQISLKRFKHTIHDPLITRDFPETLLKKMSSSGDAFSGPWDVTSNPTVYNGFMSYCPDNKMRWNVYTARQELCSSSNGLPIELDNSLSLEKIRSLRRDLARILGYCSYAHMAMETKMAPSLEFVRETLDKILDKAKTMQENELNSLQEFATSSGFNQQLEIWDVPYWERKQKSSLYNWDDRKLMEYFPFEKVLDGLLATSSKFFGLRFEIDKKNKAWHEDVRLINVYESDSAISIASIYLDPYAREGKLDSPEGFLCGLRPVSRLLGTNPPLSTLIFNFPPPQRDLPSLLDFVSVENLFKKFGQSLQQVLSHVNYSEVSGLSFIEWDAVEVVSNFMSHWLNEPAVIESISGHYKTHENLPVKDIESARNHMRGYHLCQEIYLANLDFELHTSKEFWYPLTKQLWKNHFVFKYNKNDSHPMTFVQSVAGEYSGAYYCGLWSKILAADAYNTYVNEEDKQSLGERFKDTFLGFGGSCHPSEVFRRFQGRDPQIETFIASLK